MNVHVLKGNLLWLNKCLLSCGHWAFAGSQEWWPTPFKPLECRDALSVCCQVVVLYKPAGPQSWDWDLEVWSSESGTPQLEVRLCYSSWSGDAGRTSTVTTLVFSPVRLLLYLYSLSSLMLLTLMMVGWWLNHTGRSNTTTPHFSFMPVISLFVDEMKGSQRRQKLQ